MCSCLAGSAQKWLDTGMHKALDGTVHFLATQLDTVTSLALSDDMNDLSS